MASERVAVRQGDDGDRRNDCWLELEGKYLLGGLRRESHAQKLAATLNAAFDKVEEGVRANERQKLLDEKKCCAVHRATELISGLGCGRCYDTFHCPVCCMEAVLEEACEAEEARADERTRCITTLETRRDARALRIGPGLEYAIVVLGGTMDRELAGLKPAVPDSNTGASDEQDAG